MLYFSYITYLCKNKLVNVCYYIQHRYIVEARKTLKGRVDKVLYPNTVESMLLVAEQHTFTSHIYLFNTFCQSWHIMVASLCGEHIFHGAKWK